MVESPYTVDVKRQVPVCFVTLVAAESCTNRVSSESSEVGT